MRSSVPPSGRGVVALLMADRGGRIEVSLAKLLASYTVSFIPLARTTPASRRGRRIVAGAGAGAGAAPLLGPLPLARLEEGGYIHVCRYVYVFDKR